MTPRHQRVGPSIWNQPWPDDTKLVAFYVLTNKHRVTEGLYVLPEAYGHSDMGWKPAKYRRAFRELLADGFIQADECTEVVWIVKALDWQQPQNPNQVKAAMKALEALPATPLLDRFVMAALTSPEPKLERFQKALRERFTELSAQPLTNTPSPSPSPTTPLSPQGGNLQIPVRPSGNRLRKREQYEAEVEAFAVALLPDVDPAGAVQAVKGVLGLPGVEDASLDQIATRARVLLPAEAAA